MFTASTDKTLGIWDFETGTRIKKLKGHTSFVNSCFPSRRGPQFIVSGADDCTVKVCFNTFGQGLHFFLPCFLMIIYFQSENIFKGKCKLLLRTLAQDTSLIYWYSQFFFHMLLNSSCGIQENEVVHKHSRTYIR